MKYFFDTEFHEDGKTIDLISIGIIADDGRTFYAVSHEFDLAYALTNDWLKANVLMHLPDMSEWKSRAFIRQAVLDFVGEKPEFWAYYADYDWVALCQLYGKMIDLPEGWPMYCRDIKQLCDSKGNPILPEQKGTEHDALADAVHNKQMYDFIMGVT